MLDAKIVCTLGPASADRETIEAMARAGMSVARLNASHGTVEERARLIERVRAVADDVGRPLGTMVDLRGPEIRTADVDHTVDLAAGDEVRFVHGDELTAGAIGLTVDITAVDVDQPVLLDDGQIETVVTAVEDGAVSARVEAGGTLGGRSGVNVPGVHLGVDVLTPGDEADLDLAAEYEVDFVAASFVGDRDDVLTVGQALEARGVDVPVVAKIERDAAVANLDGILDAAYGVMIARGDLGVECPLEEVPVIQKRIIRRCQRAGTPVITATEMLDSMVRATRPTRAEASDVANAVLDGTDAVMLSGETAIGDHPVGVVETMARIVRHVEGSQEYADLREQRVPPAEGTNTDALARSARFLARDIGADAIVVASESGYTALKTTKFRPAVPIVAVTPDDRVRRRLTLSWGVSAASGPLEDGDASGVIERAVDAALAAGTVASGDTLVVLSGLMTDSERETTNTLQVHIAAERLAVGAGVVAGEATGPLLESDDGDLEAIPEGAILYLPDSFEGDLRGDLDRLGGIVHERPGMTGYPAMIARELGIPMASGMVLPRSLPGGEVVTLHGDRGVVYRGDVTARQGRPPRGMSPHR